MNQFSPGSWVYSNVADPACHFDADADPDPSCHFNAYPDPTFQFNVDPDLNPSFQIKTQNLDKVLK